MASRVIANRAYGMRSNINNGGNESEMRNGGVA
jgi:hypothetical protein